MARDDLQPAAWDPSTWNPADLSASLHEVFTHVTAQARSAIDWYVKAKHPKQLWARVLRIWAILFGALAGMLPMIAQAYTNKDGMPPFQPVWSSILLALTATLVLLDRFFGFSSAWIRYVTTELRIRQVLEEFHMDWEIARAAWTGSPSAEQVQQMLARSKAFVTQVQGIVVEETNTWAREFQDTLNQLTEAAKAKSNASELGAITLTVTNGDQCAAGWDVTIDHGTPQHFIGKSAALGGLAEGIHIVAAAGSIQGAPKQAQTAATVAAGSVVPINLTLA